MSDYIYIKKTQVRLIYAFKNELIFKAVKNGNGFIYLKQNS